MSDVMPQNHEIKSTSKLYRVFKINIPVVLGSWGSGSKQEIA
jgi:hypothetical protein